MLPTIAVSTDALSTIEIQLVARDGALVELADDAVTALEQSYAALKAALKSGGAIYGVNTGFGSLSRQRIDDAALSAVQHNLIRSHASGVGDPLHPHDVRAMMLVLAAALCRGVSGVRPDVVRSLVGLLNAGVTPIVPSLGSVGASGDLAPLAHVALVLLGEGRATLPDGRAVSGAEALKAASVAPITLGPKEGLALINGTHLMAGRAALLVNDAMRLIDAAVVATAMSIDAAKASHAFLDARVYEARNQPGPLLAAERMRELLAGGSIAQSHATNDPRVQDPYSFRCAPLVLGAALDAVEYVSTAVEFELGAVTDNPLIFGTERHAEIVSAGCFHGMPVALPLDVLSIALAHVAGVAERRVYHMLAAYDKEAGLPAHLSPQPGVQSGLMITQYAAAACCNELIGLANPASVANLSTCAGMEDYNSFGPRAAAKAARAVELAEHVIAIELLCAAAALDIHHKSGLRSGSEVELAHAAIRRVVPALNADRPPAPDIAAIRDLIADFSLLPEDDEE